MCLENKRGKKNINVCIKLIFIYLFEINDSKEWFSKMRLVLCWILIFLYNIREFIDRVLVDIGEILFIWIGIYI